MKQYTVWMEIEEYDTETDEHQDLTKEGIADPVKVAVFRSVEEASTFADRFEYLIGFEAGSNTV